MPPLTKKQRIIGDIVEKIQNGQYPPGSKLPSGREICEAYGVSSATMTSAYEWLQASGYTVSVPGSGRFVADKPPRPTRSRK